MYVCMYMYVCLQYVCIVMCTVEDVCMCVHFWACMVKVCTYIIVIVVTLVIVVIVVVTLVVVLLLLLLFSSY